MKSQSKLFLLLLILIMSSRSMVGQTPSFSWGKQVGGINATLGHSIEVDAAGNVYSMGSFIGDVDFDPGPGVYTMTASSYVNFLLKLDASGNFIWVKVLEGAGDNILLDQSGYIYTAGSFNGTKDFDPSTNVYNLTSNGSFDICVSKLDTSGNFLWAKQIGSIADDYCKSFALDASKNPVITGTFKGSVDFNPNAGVYTLNAVGNEDMYIAKIDTAGNFSWAKQIGGAGYEEGNSVAIDGNGNVCAIGYFTGTVDFDPGAAVASLTEVANSGDGDAFILKLDASGNFIWVKQIGSADGEIGSNLCVDATGNVYAIGAFLGIVDFDPGIDYFPISCQGNFDVFIVKLNPSGNFIWAKTVAGVDYQLCRSVAVDAAGSIYLTGLYEADTDFNPGVDTFMLSTYALSQYMYILKLDSTGTFKWAGPITSTEYSSGNCIKVDNAGNVYTIGDFLETCDFDPGPGTYYGTSLANSTHGANVLIHKMGQFPLSLVENEKREVFIYPNPASDLVNIELAEPATVTLTDMTGQLVFERKMKNAIEQLNLGNQPDGVYRINIRSPHMDFVSGLTIHK